MYNNPTYFRKWYKFAFISNSVVCYTPFCIKCAVRMLSHINHPLSFYNKVRIPKLSSVSTFQYSYSLHDLPRYAVKYSDPCQCFSCMSFHIQLYIVKHFLIQFRNNLLPNKKNRDAPRPCQILSCSAVKASPRFPGACPRIPGAADTHRNPCGKVPPCKRRNSPAATSPA